MELYKETKGKLPANVLFMSLVRDTMRLKTKHVCEYLHDTLEHSTDQCIIFAYHHELLTSIKHMLEKLHISHVQIDGSVNMAERSKRLRQMETGDARVGVLSLATCSTGLNFIFCHWMITAELCFNAELHIQSEFRCYRNGQHLPVLHQTLVMNETTDQIVLASLVSKKRYIY